MGLRDRLDSFGDDVEHDAIDGRETPGPFELPGDRQGFAQEPAVPREYAQPEQGKEQVTLGLVGRRVVLGELARDDQALLVASLGTPVVAGMHRNASGAADFLRLPTNRVVELGSKVEI